jgi:PncC family amidohydrolase
MRAMADRLCHQLPRLLPGIRVPVVGEVWFAGIGESQAQERLAGLLTEADPMVGITVNELGHITLRAVGRAGQVRQRVRALAAAVAPWRLPEPGLAPSIIAHLARRRWTVATAESCSGGNLAAQLTAVPGCSRVLRQGHVVYHHSAKTALAGVDPDLIQRHGEVSEAVALALAQGVAERARADLGLATTGIAGPTGATPGKPVGTVWVAASLRGRAVARLVRIGGERERVQRRAACESLLLGWQLLSGGGIIK